MRPVDIFIFLQGPQGNFFLNEHFCSVVGIPINELLNLLPSELNGIGKELAIIVWATIVGCLYYEYQFSNLQMDWVLLQSKGREWVKQVTDIIGLNLEEFFKNSRAKLSLYWI